MYTWDRAARGTNVVAEKSTPAEISLYITNKDVSRARYMKIEHSGSLRT